MDKKIKHLEMIQTVIGRLSNHSFLLRGWAITLPTAVIALSDIKSSNNKLFVVILPIVIFWILDGYFISRARRYRALYDHVRVLPENKIDFSLNAKPFNTGKNTWLKSIFCTLLLFFYGSLLITVILLIWFVTQGV